MRATAELRVSCADREARERLASVLAPDNEGLPRGLEISVKEDERSLVVGVVSGSSSTALSTVLAILRDVSLFEEISLLSRPRDGRPERRKKA